MQKTILLYLNGLSHAGGMERVVSNLVGKWIDDCEIILLTKDDGKCFYPLPDGVRKLSLSIPMNMNMNSRYKRIITVFLSLYRAVINLKKILRKLEFDYIYVTSPQNAYEVYLADRSIANKKMVISEHASIYAFNNIYMWMKRKVYPNAYCISVPNRTDTPIYRSWGCNAVFIPHLFTFSIDKEIIKKEKVILNIGRLTPDKQQDRLLIIWSNIKNKNNWKLWIVGNGENKKQLEDIIKEKNLYDSVELLPAQKDIQSIYKKASLFAFTSRSEGFGMVLLEAMAFGIPCVSYDCPSGPRDVVKDGENGFLIENNNEEAFISKLQYLLTMDDDDFAKLSQGAYSTIENWDNKGIINKWKEIFK